MKKATKKQMDEALKTGVVHDYGVLGVEFVETNACKHQNQADNNSVITCNDCGLIINQ